ncbi:MAG: adenylate/guanylate cyclase domain-containing protein [Nostocales cyanobacterium]|nr:MAG: adenylate/guanylate cyclase domain-containing protein [Nostocales cyanobacterium]TAF12496.1 MAG: adenylate/guanylate cyclase domain-containing protein [Nostocales cyanobacterium]
MLDKLKKKFWEWQSVIICVPSMTFIVIMIRLTGLLQSLELKALDQMFTLRPQEADEQRIVVVEITEKDISNLKRWPILDTTLAELLTKIKLQKPRAIGLDIYRNFPVDDGYKDLVKVFESTPNLIGIQNVLENSQSFTVQPPPILKEKQQVGGNDFPTDPDGKLRRAILYYYLNGENVAESLSLKLASIYLQKEGIEAKAATTNPNYLQLGKGIFPRFEGNDGGYIRENDGSYQILLNYRGDETKFETVSLTQVLKNEISQNLMSGKIVLIGSTAESLRDNFLTPYSSQKSSKSSRLHGVYIHANLTSQILSAALDNRPQIQSWKEPEEWLWILLWSFIGSMLCWQQRKNIYLITISISITAFTLIITCLFAFLAGWWIPVIPPLLALLGSAVMILQYIANTANNMQKTFGRYLTDEVVKNLIDDPDALLLGGERRKVTILVSDVRGFSSISEQYPPEKVVEILNLYLEEMTNIINQYQGNINDFMGDGILVMFGAPISRKDDSERAVACALAMQLAMEKVNKKNQEMNLPILEMGIGINTGEVIAGNIGSQKRAEYTVIGSHVNLAARIESYSVGGQVLISEYTYQDIDLKLRIDSKFKVEPKGIKEPVNLYEVGGIEEKYNLFLPRIDENIELLNDQLAIEFVVLYGKKADGNLLPGALVGLSENGAKLQCKYELEILTNIKLKLLTETAVMDEEPDIYAKVMKKFDQEENYYLIRFTGIPPKGLKRLRKVKQDFG